MKKKRSHRYRRREPSLGEFIEWVNQLDDSYKIFLFSLLNAIFWFIFMITGQSVDPDSIKELLLGTLIEATGNETLIFIWTKIAQPISSVFGIIQLIISLYAIYKFRIVGIVVASTGFTGFFTLLVTVHYQLPQVLVYLSLILIIISYVFARMKSNLRFDRDGRVIVE